MNAALSAEVAAARRSVQAFELRRGAGLDGLARVRRPLPEPGPREVRVRIRAVSLNARDLAIAESGEGAVVAASDGAGEIEAIGRDVTRWRIGDRIATSFYPRWIDGPPTATATTGSLGGAVDGVLAEAIVAHEDALFAVPHHLDFVEAATLPCAALTAWHALFGTGPRTPGETVLLLGTGGVSTWALTLARAAGLRTIITSSDDAKLERARALGAHATMNYRTHPDWSAEVRYLTLGQGADLVVEIGGEHTLGPSIAATRAGGTIAMVGGASGGFGARLDPFALIDGAKRLVGVLVGSRGMAEDLVRFVALHGLRPSLDRVFAFDDAPAAFAHLASGRHFGKVVIRVA
jgi:NADPH:quinone reductase-like Zn-dependent oxidoreductase